MDGWLDGWMGGWLDKTKVILNSTQFKLNVKLKSELSWGISNLGTFKGSLIHHHEGAAQTNQLPH